jgi:transposase
VLLPVSLKARSRAPADNRNIVNGILWRLRISAPWHSIDRRFQRWSACGVWDSVAIALAETMAESGHYDIDNTTVPAHVSAASGKGGSSTSSWPIAGRVHQ